MITDNSAEHKDNDRRTSAKSGEKEHWNCGTSWKKAFSRMVRYARFSIHKINSDNENFSAYHSPPYRVGWLTKYIIKCVGSNTKPRQLPLPKPYERIAIRNIGRTDASCSAAQKPYEPQPNQSGQMRNERHGIIWIGKASTSDSIRRKSTNRETRGD